MPIAKSLNYMPAIIGTKFAKDKGVDEILFLEQGTENALEGVTSNFFGVKDGKVYTAEENVLPGITRIFILEKCAEMGIEVVKGVIPSSQLPTFEEAFLSSTTKEIVPVVEIDGRWREVGLLTYEGKVIGNGEVGPIFKKLKAHFPTVNW